MHNCTGNVISCSLLAIVRNEGKSIVDQFDRPVCSAHRACNCCRRINSSEPVAYWLSMDILVAFHKVSLRTVKSIVFTWKFVLCMVQIIKYKLNHVKSVKIINCFKALLWSWVWKKAQRANLFFSGIYSWRCMCVGKCLSKPRFYVNFIHQCSRWHFSQVEQKIDFPAIRTGCQLEKLRSSRYHSIIDVLNFLY